MTEPAASPFSRPPAHRATRRYQITPMEIAIDVALTALMLAGVYAAWPFVLAFWHGALQFWLERVQVLGHEVTLHEVKLPWVGPAISLMADDVLPSALQWWGGVAVMLGALGLSFIISRERLPLVYLLRTLAFIQATALVYFYLWPARLPVTLAKFGADLIQMVGTMLFIVPLLHGFTLYIFRMSLWRKLLTTLVSVIYVALCLPPHLSLLIWLMQKGSVLMLPMTYFVLMLLPYIMVLIAIYGYALSLTPSDAEKTE
ncbi:MAG: hypothetical protein Q4A28_00890 [Brachymonas sp.]|nr:hypothetical protein [Brachymonas sp.]